MLSVAVDVWIGNAAAVLSGCWGAVTRRAPQTGYSRTAIYKHAQRVEHAVVNERTGGVSYEALWADKERLRAENEALWEAWMGAALLPESTQQAFAATGAATGLRLGQILLLFAMILPQGSPPSRATVGRWSAQASRQAGGLLAVLDQYGQRVVLGLCLDEIFFHRVPILMAVEPHRMTWVTGQRGPDRSGERGGQVLAHWPHVTRVVADAGQGLERGGKLAREARRTAAEGQENAATMPLQRGLDVFHTQRELQRVVHSKGKRAERQLETATEADHKVAQSKQHGRDARGVAQHARRAWPKAERCFDEAVQTAGVVRRVAMALAVLRPDGQLNDRAWAQEQLREATKLLVGPEWDKVRRFLREERTLYYLDWLHEQLPEAVEDPLWREACARVWSLRETMRHTHGAKRDRLAPLAALEQARGQHQWPEWQAAYARVHETLSRVGRASSAVECLNSVRRMHQARHRHVSQGMLDLKRLYWHCRTFRHGKRKKMCPYELLGLKLPTYRWWTLLQLDPKEVEKKLSTHRVAV